ncbi:MAG: hypothetical protein ACREDX_11835 [Aestuariivirga sp.]
MTYTVFDTDGTVIARHLSAEAAAIAVLTHGHGAFDIRPDGKDFALWMTPQPGSGSITELARSQIASAETDATAARKEIFSQVITASGGWHGPTVIDDATYDLQLAGFENE